MASHFDLFCVKYSVLQCCFSSLEKKKKNSQPEHRARKKTAEPGKKIAQPGGIESFVMFTFRHSHSKEVNERYFMCCHMLPLQQDYICLCPSLFDSHGGLWGSCYGRELQALYPWLMVTNKPLQVKTTVRGVLFIFCPFSALDVRTGGRQIRNKCSRWEKVAPSLWRPPSCQRFTALLWPQLLSKWQTVWRSQVVGNLSRRPLKQVAPGPSLQASGRQTSDKQLFVLGHVLPSSPLLFSPLGAHFC